MQGKYNFTVTYIIHYLIIVIIYSALAVEVKFVVEHWKQKDGKRKLAVIEFSSCLFEDSVQHNLLLFLESLVTRLQ